MPYALRNPPQRPAYLDYPYNTDEPAFSFWDDHKHQIWGLIIAAIVTFGAYALYQTFDLCACGDRRGPADVSMELT